jgi:hypothetical protein
MPQGMQRESTCVDQESPWGKGLISPLVYSFTPAVQSLKSPAGGPLNGDKRNRWDRVQFQIRSD